MSILHSAPIQLASTFDTTFGHQLGDVLVGERIPEIPAHAQNDDFSRVMSPFERIVRVDRPGLLAYRNAGSEVRNLQLCNTATGSLQWSAWERHALRETTTCS